MVWQYTANPPIFNDFTGSAQRLANGNTVVAFTRHGIVDEVRPDGTLLSRATIESAAGQIATPYRVYANQELVFVRPALGILAVFRTSGPLEHHSYRHRNETRRSPTLGNAVVPRLDEGLEHQ